MRGIGVKCSSDTSKAHHPHLSLKGTRVRLQPPTPLALIKRLKVDECMDEGEVGRPWEGRQRQ